MFPQGDIGTDPAAIPGFAGPPYVHDRPFHEPLVLFAHLAGVL